MNKKIKIELPKTKNNLVIVISGTVGVGKSTLTKALAKRIENSISFKEETLDSPYFKRYYENINVWSAVAQVDYLIERHKKWLTAKDMQGVLLFDRHFLDDYLFSLINIENNIFDETKIMIYEQIFNRILQNEENKKMIDVFIQLKTDKETVIDRIFQRGRAEETSFDKEYFDKLYNLYYDHPAVQDLFKRYSKKFITVDASSPVDEIVEQIIERITK